MSRLAAIIEAEALGQAPSPIPEPPAPAGTWPNGYTWRADYRIDSGLIDGDIAGALVDLAVPVASRVVESDAADIRLEVDGSSIPYRLQRYDDVADIAYIRARVPLIAAASDTIISVYAGKTGAAGEENATGVYAGMLLAIDGATGEDLTGQGRDGTPSGVTAGTMADGRACGVYDGEAIISAVAVVDWIAGRDALSIVADIEADAAMDDTNAVLWTQSAATDASTAVTAGLTRLALTSGGVPNVWNAAVRTTLALNAYVLGTADTAGAGPAIVASTWAQGEAPDIYVDGVLQLSSVAVARDAPIQYLSGGWHLGTGFVGKIAEVLVSPEALSPLLLDIDQRSKRAPLSLWGVGAWHEVDDAAPCIAMPVRAVATGDETVSIDVLASAIGSGLTLESVTAGPRGAVEIVGGEANYTATGSAAGTDYFAFTIEGSGGRQSTGRCDINITAADDPGSDDALQLPAAVGEPIVVSTTAQLVSACAAGAAGRHILLAAGGTFPAPSGNELTISGGTEALPVIIRAQNKNNVAKLTGEWRLFGDHWQFWGTIFDRSAGGAGSRAVRLETCNNGLFAYCTVKPGGMGIEWRSNGATNIRCHRTHFDGSGQVSGGSNGYEAFKTGVGNSWNVDLNALFDLCYFTGFDKEREMCKFNSKNTRMIRCHTVGCRDVSFRFSEACSVIECRIEGPGGGNTAKGRLTAFGPDNIIRNNIVGSLLLCRGTHASETPPGPGSTYFACARNLVQNNTANQIVVGRNLFSTAWPFQAVDTTASGNSVALTSENGASWGLAGSVAVVAPPTLSTSVTGIGGYAALVSGA